MFIDVSETYKLIWGVKKLLHRNVLWRFDPLLLDIYRKHTYVHFDATIRFNVCLRIFRISSINLEVSGYGGSKKCGVFAGTYFHVRIICMCFIERIRFYVHGLGVLFVWKSPNCELVRFFGCLYVRMPRVQKPSVFTRASRSVYPPTRKSKNCIHTSIHPYIFALENLIQSN